MQNEMKYKLTSPYFSRAIPKLLIHLTKEWGLMNGERPIGLKMAWDAAALLDKAIHVSPYIIYCVSYIIYTYVANYVSTICTPYHMGNIEFILPENYTKLRRNI